MLKPLILIIMVTSNVNTKRCRGRKRVGRGCTSICDFSTGRWETERCYEFEPLPPSQPSPCNIYCINNSSQCQFRYCLNNSTECEFSHFPPTVGDCNDESGPCYEPDYCSRLVGECEYYCESPVESVVTCTYELTQLRYENRPGVPPPPVPLAGGCSDSHEVCSDNPCDGYMKEPECVDLC